MSERVQTYGMTKAAARAIIRAGGRVVFEACPGCPASANSQQPVIYLPPGVVRDPVGPCGPHIYRLGTSWIAGDYQHRQFRLCEAGAGCPDPAENGTNGYWGEPLTPADLAHHATEALVAALDPASSYPGYPESVMTLFTMDTRKREQDTTAQRLIDAALKAIDTLLVDDSRIIPDEAATLALVKAAERYRSEINNN